MIHLLGIGLMQAALGASPRRAIQLAGLGLQSGNYKTHRFSPFSVFNRQGRNLSGIKAMGNGLMSGFELARLADHFPDTDVKQVGLIGRLEHQGCIGAAASAAYGDDIAARKGAGIGRHDGNLNGHLGALAEQPQGVGDQQGRVDAAVFLRHGTLHAGEGVGGGHDHSPFGLQVTARFRGHYILKWLSETAMVGHHHNFEALEYLKGRVGSISFCRGHHQFIQSQGPAALKGQTQCLLRIFSACFIKIHGALLFAWVVWPVGHRIQSSPLGHPTRLISVCLQINGSFYKKSKANRPGYLIAMIIDIHTHVFARSMRQSRENFFTNEPAFKLLYDNPKSRLAGAEEIITMMDAQGVDKSVILGFPWRSADTFKRHNDYILNAVSRFAHRLIGFCCLDPFHPHAPDEVQRCLSAGLAGVGELAFYTSGIDEQCLDRLEPIMNLAAEDDLPVMVHTNEPVGHTYPGKTPNTLAQIYALVKRYARNRIVLAHWGGGLFLYTLLKKEVSETLQNVWFDTAASPYLYQPDIYQQAIALAGEDKVLLGSDYPLIKPKRYFNEMALAGLTADQQAKISGLNAATLLKVTTKPA